VFYCSDNYVKAVSQQVEGRKPVPGVSYWTDNYVFNAHFVDVSGGHVLDGDVLHGKSFRILYPRELNVLCAYTKLVGDSLYS
jgi:hypothetical protein